MATDDPERLILVLRLAVKMRKLQIDYAERIVSTKSTYLDDENARHALKKAEREFDIAAEDALR
ncbi:MAG: hypothetical protein JSR91_00395 [Proteobacteria bacterium]|nr:hypothetical protein [Pseudomonadota bacterium]